MNRNPAAWIAMVVCGMMASWIPAAALGDEPQSQGGALAGERFRVLISSDIGGSDPDDIQSFIHFLMYADLFDIEGLVSSPPHRGRAADFLNVIDLYEKDYPKLRARSDKFPAAEDLRSIVKQGATDKAPSTGYSQATEGSRWIVECAKRSDPRPLHVLVWGSITDVAQALYDNPEIKAKLRVYFIAGWNQAQCPDSYNYIDNQHKDLFMVYSGTTFRGMYMGGDQSGDLGNQSFIDRHIQGRGYLGDLFATLRTNTGGIKMGDTPSLLWLMRGNPADPTRASWGGRFVKLSGRPNWYVDDPDPELVENGRRGARTVNRWRVDYLRDWQTRLAWLKTPGKNEK